MYFFFVNKLAPKVYLIKKIVRKINERELSLAEGLSKEKALNIFEVKTISISLDKVLSPDQADYWNLATPSRGNLTQEALGEVSESRFFCTPLPCFAIEAKAYPGTSDEESLLGH